MGRGKRNGEVRLEGEGVGEYFHSDGMPDTNGLLLVRIEALTPVTSGFEPGRQSNKAIFGDNYDS